MRIPLMNKDALWAVFLSALVVGGLLSFRNPTLLLSVVLIANGFWALAILNMYGIARHVKAEHSSTKKILDFITASGCGMAIYVLFPVLLSPGSASTSIPSSEMASNPVPFLCLLLTLWPVFAVILLVDRAFGSKMSRGSGYSSSTPAERPALAMSRSRQGGQSNLSAYQNLLKQFDAEDAYAGLSKSIFGQEAALRMVVNTLDKNIYFRRQSKNANNKPIAVFLVVGPTGVGKTETAKALAKILGYERLTLAMNEYANHSDIARLVGSSPGYINSDQGGQLTRPMFQNPCRLILFDEIEKADPSISNVFLSIFDEGKLAEAASGKLADFSRSVLFLTSNLGNEKIGGIMEEGLNEVDTAKKVRDVLVKGGLKPELIGRVDNIIPYSRLSIKALEAIARNVIKGSPKWKGKVLTSSLVSSVTSTYKPLADAYGVREFTRRIQDACFNGKLTETNFSVESSRSTKPLSSLVNEDGVIQYLGTRIVGQNKAVMKIGRTIDVGIQKKEDVPSSKPIATFLAVGPTGVGKTETAKILAEYMKTLDSDYELLSFDMGDYYDKSTQSALTGAPPGYIGSDTSGRLTGAIKANPKRVILFDEVEKGDHGIMDIFLSIFDEGRLTDTAQNFTVSFKDCIILITSNLGSDEIAEVLRSAGDKKDGEVERDVKNILKGEGIRPELISRVSAVLPYRPLDDSDYVKIIESFLVRHPRSKKLGDISAIAYNIVKNNSHLKAEGVRGYVRKAEEFLYPSKKSSKDGHQV